MLREGVRDKHLEDSLVYTYFLLSHEDKLFSIHQTSSLPVEALAFSELKTPLLKSGQKKTVSCICDLCLTHVVGTPQNLCLTYF